MKNTGLYIIITFGMLVMILSFVTILQATDQGQQNFGLFNFCAWGVFTMIYILLLDKRTKTN